MDVSLKHGHRRRVRHKLLNDCGDAMLDYELIEALLFGAIPRRDIRDLSKYIMSKFPGGIYGLFNASINQLKSIDGLGDSSIALLLCVRSIINRYISDTVRGSNVLANWQAVLEYLRLTMNNTAHESLRVIYLNKKHEIIDDILDSGTVDKVHVYDREIVKHALEKGAASIIISHNHLSSDPSPSSSDIAATKKLIGSCNVFSIHLIDHIIIANGGYFSFREQGIL